MKEFSPGFIVHDKVQIRLTLETKLETEQEGRFRRALENLAFANRVRDFLLGDDFSLRQDLHRVDSFRVLFPNLEHSAKGAFPNHSEEIEIVDGETFLCLQEGEGG